MNANTICNSVVCLMQHLEIWISWHINKTFEQCEIEGYFRWSTVILLIWIYYGVHTTQRTKKLQKTDKDVKICCFGALDKGNLIILHTSIIKYQQLTCFSLWILMYALLHLRRTTVYKDTTTKIGSAHPNSSLRIELNTFHTTVMFRT